MAEIHHLDKNDPEIAGMMIGYYILAITQNQTKLQGLDTCAFLLALLTSPRIDDAEAYEKSFEAAVIRAREYLIKTHHLDCTENPQNKKNSAE